MYEQRRFPRLSWIAIAGGLAWLWVAAADSPLTLVLTLPVGGLLLSTGIGLLLWPGDFRITQTMALGGALAVLATLPMALAVGALPALLLGLFGAAAMLVSGAAAVYQEPWLPGVPKPEPGLGLSAMVCADEVVLGFEQFNVALPTGHDGARMVDEVHHARQLYAERGWLEDPASFHVEPPPLDDPRIRTRRRGGVGFEHVTYESGYAPHPDEPGRDRWLGYAPNRTGHAWLLRHREGQRPWLICSNGFRTGHAPVDVRLFREYHETLGLNVLMPVLPLHGPRRIGRLSGDGFLSGEVMDTVHGVAQAIWDLRRLIGWVRAEGAPAVGTLGLSLGGFATSLLVGIEGGLAAVIAGIPVADLPRVFWRHGPKLQLDYLRHVDVDEALVAEIMHPISPLAFAPRVPYPGRMIFGGVSDRLVPPDHVRDLAEHWEHPRTVWYQGGHLTFWRDPRVKAGVDATLREAKLTA